MKKTELLIASVSLATTLLIATLFGFAGSAIVGTFWSWFTISVLIQVIVFFAINSFLIKRDSFLLEESEVKALEAFSKFAVNITCAYCQKSNTVPIQLNQRNTFKCEGCNQSNSVAMQFFATTLTTPINSVKLPLPDSESIEFKVRT